MVVELSQDDWKRLTGLVHQYGSFASLEQALREAGRAAPTSGSSVDLADMVRVEVAHQLASARAGRPRPAAPWCHAPNFLRRHRLWLGALLATIALGLASVVGVPPLFAAGAGILAVVGVASCLRPSGGIAWLAWRATLAGCVLAWAMAIGWPVVITLVISASVLALCVVEPIRTHIERSRTE